MNEPTPKLKPNYDSPWRGNPKQDNKATIILFLMIIIIANIVQCS